jgi:hypothetical protein
MTLVSSLASETSSHGQAQGWAVRSAPVVSSATVTGSDSSDVCAKAGAALITKPAKTAIATQLTQCFESWLTEILLVLLRLRYTVGQHETLTPGKILRRD